MGGQARGSRAEALSLHVVHVVQGSGESPGAEGVMLSSSGFGLGHGKPDESSQSCHTQGHAPNDSHAHQSIYGGMGGWS